MSSEQSEKAADLKVLVFSTDSISDQGIDFAGSTHMHYPLSVLVVSLPCSSGIRPQWILYALERGFDGVFIAADGTDCVYLTDCTQRTGSLYTQAQSLVEEHGYDPRRLKMGAICSVCAESFVTHMKNFINDLINLRSA